MNDKEKETLRILLEKISTGAFVFLIIGTLVYVLINIFYYGK